MKKNMGTTDKSIRILAAIVIALLYYTGTISGTLGLVLLIAAALFLITSFISFCPLYTLIKVNTNKKE